MFLILGCMMVLEAFLGMHYEKSLVCRMFQVQDHHNHITVALHSIYYKTTQHIKY